MANLVIKLIKKRKRERNGDRKTIRYPASSLGFELASLTDDEINRKYEKEKKNEIKIFNIISWWRAAC